MNAAALRRLAILVLMGAAARVDAQGTGAQRQPEPVIGGRCEGCEAVFQGRPTELSSVARLAGGDESGEPMRIEGVVRNEVGQPVAGVIVYAYHTDAEGVYPPEERLPGTAAYRHGRLRGWALTDTQGRYTFDTIRPGSYPSRNAPAHVHMHVLEPGCCTYYIDDIHFTDDPLLTATQRRDLADGRGGGGLVEPVRDGGRWTVRRDIVLGRNIPGYDRARRP